MEKPVLILFREQDCNKKRRLIQALCGAWEKRGYQTETLSVPERVSVTEIISVRERPAPGEDWFSAVCRKNPDYLATIDMVGFERTTLLEGSVYNLLHAKQLHLLTGDCGQYEELLQREYAINLFFFSDREETVRDWEKRYPGLPHLERMPEPGRVEEAVEKLLAPV